MLYVWPMKYRRDGKKLKHCYCLRGSAGVEEVDLNENINLRGKAVSYSCHCIIFNLILARH